MKPCHSLLLIVVGLWATPVQATLEIFFAEDVSKFAPVNQGGPNDVPRPVFTNSQQMATQFLARLQGVATESFEGRPNGSAPTNLLFGPDTATLSGTRIIATVLSPTQAPGGGFAVTGTNYLNLTLPGSGTVAFTIAFDTPQSAFGFYGMDVEFNRFRLTLNRADGSTTNLVVPVTVPQGSGGVFYYGVIDRAQPFTSVTFQNTGSINEGFCFDDLTIGRPDQVLPAPARLEFVNRSATNARVRLFGTVSATYRLEFSPVLPGTNWTPVTTLTLPASPVVLTNNFQILPPRRFYRAVGITQ